MDVVIVAKDGIDVVTLIMLFMVGGRVDVADIVVVVSG